MNWLERFYTSYWQELNFKTKRMIRMKIRSTTILAVRHKGQVALAGDGQVSLGNTIMKHQARKVRRLYHDRVITGFAGATADALPCMTSWNRNLNSTAATCSGPRLNWPRIGGPINSCAGWKPC